MVFDIMSDGLRRQFQETNDVDFSFELGDLARFRVNVFRGRRGEGAVFRTIPTKVMTIEDLGLPSILKEVCDKEKGLVLVTGPTGSGKSTTLAAMIDYINESFEGHILTIEDPIEFVHHSKKCLVNQREVGTHTMSFTAALRGALREDPDVILVGEMRDLETISLALTAAETGHLVFGTLHTSSAPKTVDRIIDVFPAAQQEQIRIMFSESIQAVITQTLLKKRGRRPHRGARDPDRHAGGAQPDPRGQDPPDPVRHADRPEGRHADARHGAHRAGAAQHDHGGGSAVAHPDAEPLRQQRRRAAGAPAPHRRRAPPACVESMKAACEPFSRR